MNATQPRFQFPVGRVPSLIPGAIELHGSLIPDPVYRSHQYFNCNPVAVANPIKESSLPPPESPSILVVDECPGFADVAKAFLEAEGYRVRALWNRVRAWQTFYFSRPRPGLLITDDLGGPQSGIELIRRCKRLEPDLKALWVSHRSPASLTKADRDLLDGFQPRPYCGPLLAQTVRRLFGFAC